MGQGWLRADASGVFLFYNFIRTLGKLRMSHAMVAGIATTFMSFEGVLTRIDAAQAPKARGPDKKRPA
jgi:hypothetical protein